MPLSRTEQLIAEHIEPIVESLRHLQRLLSVFGKELSQAATPAVVFEPTMDPKSEFHNAVTGYRELGAGPSRQRAIDALLQIKYGLSDEVNQSTRCHGALGVPKRLINDAVLINRAKSEFKDALRAVAGRRVRIPVKDRYGMQTVAKKALSNVILRRTQSSSVNLLAAYRDIPLVEETPQSIQLMLTRTRSVPRKTVAALLDLLADRDDALTQSDRDRLETLDGNEYLVSPKERYPRMRAHVFYRRLDKFGKADRQIIMAELPILYPIRKGTRPPDVSGPTIRKIARQHPQSFIEPEEFVRTLHYRRMKPGHRQYARDCSREK